MDTLKRTREQIIEELIEQDISDIVDMYLQESDTEYLSNILRGGHEGYQNLDDSVLVNEYKERCSPDDVAVELIADSKGGE